MEGQSSASAPLNIDRGSKERDGGRQRNWQEGDGDVSRVTNKKKWVRKQRPSKEKTERLRLPKNALCAFKHGNKNLNLLGFFLLVF